MTEDENIKFAKYTKIGWTLYYLAAFVLIVILVTVVAQDNEERLFYSLMTAACSYVFRPTEKFFNKQVMRFIDTKE
ncbi:hypothetical protein [Oceanicoccus sagamiensis]|uniref:Uncharacterized protein n=1 Tax=Oceanicoccus sagamiensis TaxID=716816 RepID=A0A1X9NI39_9GAMM|nr:hypothetical protein [Oceanicoccus sagamiensis]ARN76062.1 hypothetical protein BST96_19350 [Oceanicoccus sagamiensis]